MNVKKTVIGLTVGGGIVIILGGVFGWAVLPAVVDEMVRKDTTLEEGTPIYKIWEDVPVPIKMKYRFFDVQNPEEVRAGGKPRVLEKGPYTYIETRKKVEVRQGEFNDLIKYKEIKIFEFSPTDSAEGVSESDKVTTINILYAAIGKIVRDLLSGLPPSVLTSVFNFLDRRLTEEAEGLLMERTVDEILYKGWDISSYLDIVRELCDFNLVDVVCNSVGINEILDDLGQHPYFGLFSTKNNTDDGEFIVGTGQSNSRYVGEIWTWKGKESLTYWDKPWEGGDYCNMMNGTDGTIFRPFLDEKEKIHIFQTDLCRSIFLDYESKLDYKGITVNHYVLSPSVSAHPTMFPDNICFCEDVKNISTCLRAPALPLDKCLFGAPVIGSSAHFFDGDGYYLSLIEDLAAPNSSHQTFADIEPLTGAPFSICKRVQLNIDFKKYAGLSGFDNITGRTVFPMLWFEESASMTDELIEAFRGMVIIPIQAIEGIRWTLVSIGTSLIVAALILFILKRNK